MPTSPTQPSRKHSSAHEPAMPSGTAHAMWTNETCPIRRASEEANVITSPVGNAVRAPRSMRRYLRRTWVPMSAVMDCEDFHASAH